MPDDDSTVAASAGPDYDEQSLVRPYVRRYEQTRAQNSPEAAPDGPPKPIGPPAQADPAPPSLLDPQAIVDTVPPAMTVDRGRRRVLLTAGCGALAFALAAVVLAVSAGGLPGGRGSDTAAGGSPETGRLETARLPSPSAGPNSPTAAATSTAPFPTPSTSPYRSPETRSDDSEPGDSVGFPTPHTSTEPPHVLSRSGRITSVAGLCLDGGAGNNKNNDRLRLRDCDGTEGQVWTVAGDGTVRVQGRCMLATTGLVRLRDCDGDAGQQWRLGTAGSLVNPASGLCLGSPAGDAGRGTPQRVAACNQSDAQRWTLP